MRKTNFDKNSALNALKQDREEGLAFFFNEHYTALCFFANSILHDACLAEEVTSEAFIKLWERRENFTMESNIKSWLYSTVRNAAIDHIRKVKRMHVKERGLQSINTVEQSVLHNIMQTETIRQIISALDRLPPKCRQVFELHFIRGKSCEQIAVELQVSSRTVRSHRQKALDLLKQNILLLFIFWMACQSFAPA